MKKYLIYIQYYGKKYCGFQRQDVGASIQQILEEALEKTLGQKIEIFASGRTDAGVSALEQTAHFEADTTIPANKIPFAVNPILPSDIKILKCKNVSGNFHARFNVVKKTYQYNLYASPVQQPIKSLTALWIKKMPDIELMKNSAKLLVGEHNFKGFMSAGGQAKTFDRTIFDLKITKKGNEITIQVTGSGFLYNMVRIIVGTLLEVGYGRKTAEDIKKVLTTGDRSLAGYLVKPDGLFLKKVYYNNNKKIWQNV